MHCCQLHCQLMQMKRSFFGRRLTLMVSENCWMKHRTEPRPIFWCGKWSSIQSNFSMKKLTNGALHSKHGSMARKTRSLNGSLVLMSLMNGRNCSDYLHFFSSFQKFLSFGEMIFFIFSFFLFFIYFISFTSFTSFIPFISYFFFISINFNVTVLTMLILASFNWHQNQRPIAVY